MKTKKIILLLLTTILLASIFVVTVAAADNAVATTDGKDCVRGETVTLDVNVSDVSNVYSGAVVVEYDSTVLEFVSAAWNTDDVLEYALLKNYDAEKNKGAFSFATEQSISGKIFSITFKVLDGAALGQSEVKCNIQLKSTEEVISVTNTAGYVNVLCNHSLDMHNNSEEHWHECSICGEKLNAEAHEWVDGKCVDCNAEQPDPPQIEDPEEPKDEGSDTPKDEGGGFKFSLSDPKIILLLIALLIITSLLAITIKDEFY